MTDRKVIIPIDNICLHGDLIIPANAKGVVIFAHGSGSSRLSRRNQSVARILNDAGLGTLLFDLLTCEEESVDVYTRHLRFDIELLAMRLAATTRWLKTMPEARNLNVGLFGASTGAAAALVAAAELGDLVRAVVSRGGRPDLANQALAAVTASVLLIVGSNDEVVIDLNRQAFANLHCEKKLEIVAGATHLFEEPGALETVGRLAAEWFVSYLSTNISDRQEVGKSIAAYLPSED